MAVVYRWLKQAAQLPLIYLAALSLALVAGMLLRSAATGWGLRGGLLSDLLVLTLTAAVCGLAVVQVMRSNLSRLRKFGLALPLGWAIWIVGRAALPLLLIGLFFGQGVCRMGFTAPSGSRSITIESACFMGCTHTVHRNYFIFEQQIGEIYLDSGNLCRLKDQMTLRWNADETAIDWQVHQQRGTLTVQ